MSVVGPFYHLRPQLKEPYSFKYYPIKPADLTLQIALEPTANLRLISAKEVAF